MSDSEREVMLRRVIRASGERDGLLIAYQAIKSKLEEAQFALDSAIADLTEHDSDN